MGDFSTELCGGTHVENTGNIVTFKIVGESGIAANVRRIEALTGDCVFQYYKEMESQLNEVAKVAKTDRAGLVKKIQSLQGEVKSLQSENQKLKDKAAKESLGNVLDQVRTINDVKVLAAKVADVDMNGLRTLGDELKSKLGDGVVVLASALDGKVSLVAMATDSAVKAGVHAGNLIKEIASMVGGGGGGRPNMAQAGGKNPAGIDDAIAKAWEVVTEQMK